MPASAHRDTLRKLMLTGPSRAGRDHIVSWIGNDPAKAEALIRLFTDSEYRVVQYLAWVISALADAAPHLLEPAVPALVATLNEGRPPVAIRRNIIRVLQFLPLPEAVHGPLLEIAFGYLSDPDETIAVKANAMNVAARLVPQYPEIRNELRTLLEFEMEKEASPGIKNRAAKVLKQLKTDSLL